MKKNNTILTAYNQDVQRYFRGSICNKIRKETIISIIEEAVINKKNKSFNQLFPKKKLLVLDEIIYLLSGAGICTIGAEKLAEKAGCSVRTVYSTVKSLKETGEVIIGRLANKKLGKYIFVLKSHPDIHTILQEVFFVNELPKEQEETKEIAEQVTGHFAGLQNSQNLETVGLVSNKSSSILIKPRYLKQEKDIIKNDNYSTYLITDEMIQKFKNEYKVNEYQLSLYKLIMESPFPDSIKAEATTLVLIMGKDCDRLKMIMAFQIIHKMSLNIIDGIPINNVKAVFRESINKKIASV